LYIYIYIIARYKIGSELIGKTKKKIIINWRESGHASMGKVYEKYVMKRLKMKIIL